LRKRDARWLKPELVVGVRHLCGSGGLRHATVKRTGEACGKRWQAAASRSPGVKSPRSGSKEAMGHGAPVHEVDAQGHRGRQAVTTHASCEIVLVNFDAGSPGWARPVKRSWTKPVSDPRRPWTN
jgi:hypothetical protein